MLVLEAILLWQGRIVFLLFLNMSHIEVGFTEEFGGLELFGLFDSKHHDYYHFRSWEESVSGYVRMIQRRYNPKKDKDYYAFLKRIGYAENIDSYNAKVRAIANTL